MVTQRKWIVEFAQAGVESAEGAFAFLGKDDWLRDRFPLPSADERDRWLAFWSDDRLAWDTVVEAALGQKLSTLAGSNVLDYFDRLRAFFNRDVCELDSFFRSLEMRFVFRAFLPCVARIYRRPSSTLNEIVANKDFLLLETAVRIDPSVLHHRDLTGLLNPLASVARRQRWELLQSALTKPAEDTDRRLVKYGIAAFLRLVATRCGSRLTLAELLRMYNDVATTDHKRIRDIDLPDDPATFQKGVRRFGSRLPKF
jgi:hypothetical protein